MQFGLILDSHKFQSKHFRNTTQSNKRNNQNSTSKRQDNYMKQGDTNDWITQYSHNFQSKNNYMKEGDTNDRILINVAILTFLLSTIPFSTKTSRYPLHMMFTCRSWYDIREPVILIRILYIDLSC